MTTPDLIEISDCVFFLTRGLRHLLHYCITLRAFKELTNLNPLNYLNFYLCVPIPSMLSAIVLYHDLK
jgi:hypothetical protein